MSFIKHLFNKDSLEQIKFQDIQKLIDNKTEESLHLDYEEIPRDLQYDGLADHISGFLNTSGGIVVFGVSETEEKGRHVPYKTTWTTIKKETLENNLYRKIDPWYEDIQIFPIQNPDEKMQRIFVILIPKSKSPPHMSNYRYFIRLNFQTQPIGHDQVSSIFKQYYLQKYDLVNTVYGPIYNELVSHLNQTRIRQWSTIEYDRVLKDRLFLLTQDFDLYENLDSFYERVGKWNQAVRAYPFRMAKIINDLASSFFKKSVFVSHDRSAVRMEIKAESTQQIIKIDEAVLNQKDPLDFWKEDYPFDRILEIQFQLEHTESKMVGTYDTMTIPKKQFNDFMKQLRKEVQKDELINFIQGEFNDLKSTIESLLDELKSRM